MSNLWNEPGMPHKDWTCVGFEDTESIEHTCDMCKHEGLRYLYTMKHKWFGDKTLVVGSRCVELMSMPSAKLKKYHILVQKLKSNTISIKEINKLTKLCYELGDIV